MIIMLRVSSYIYERILNERTYIARYTQATLRITHYALHTTHATQHTAHYSLHTIVCSILNSKGILFVLHSEFLFAVQTPKCACVSHRCDPFLLVAMLGIIMFDNFLIADEVVGLLKIRERIRSRNSW